jgi:hypothetical protein
LSSNPSATKINVIILCELNNFEVNFLVVRNNTGAKKIDMILRGARKPGMVEHAYKPSYSRGGGRRI